MTSFDPETVLEFDILDWLDSASYGLSLAGIENDVFFFDVVGSIRSDRSHSSFKRSSEPLIPILKTIVR